MNGIIDTSDLTLGIEEEYLIVDTETATSFASRIRISWRPAGNRRATT